MPLSVEQWKDTLKELSLQDDPGFGSRLLKQLEYYRGRNRFGNYSLDDIQQVENFVKAALLLWSNPPKTTE